MHAGQAWLILGWVGWLSTGRYTISVCNQRPTSTQPSTLHGTVKWVSAFMLSYNNKCLHCQITDTGLVCLFIPVLIALPLKRGQAELSWAVGDGLAHWCSTNDSWCHWNISRHKVTCSRHVHGHDHPSWKPGKILNLRLVRVNLGKLWFNCGCDTTVAIVVK